MVPKNDLASKEKIETLYQLTNDLEQEFTSDCEGKRNKRFVATYERSPRLRESAINEHGLDCMACGFNFGQFYGSYAEGFIHVHHVVPVSELGNDGSKVDPKSDMIVLCPNCHAVVHRMRKKTLSLDELKEMIRNNR